MRHWLLPVFALFVLSCGSEGAVPPDEEPDAGVTRDAQSLGIDATIPIVVHSGSVLIETESDLVVARRFTEIAGSLIIRVETATIVKLPLLERVEDVVVSSESLLALELPALRAAYDVNLGSDPVLNRVELPALESLSSLTIIECPRISAIPSLPSLRELDGLHVEHAEALATLEGLSSLIRLEQLRILGENRLTDLRGLQGLHRGPRDINIQDAPMLSALTGLPAANFSTITLANLPSLSDLSAIGIAGYVEYVSLSNLPRVTTLDTFDDATYIDDLSIRNMPALTGVSLGKLGGIDTLDLAFLPKLATLSLPALINAFTILIYDVGLETFELPEVGFLNELRAVQMPRLTSLGPFPELLGNMTVFELAALPRLRTVQMPAVFFIREMIVRDAPVLDAVDFSEFGSRIDTLTLARTGLVEFGVEQAVAFERDFTLSANPSLEVVEIFSGLFVNSLYVEDNPELVAIRFASATRQITQMILRGAPKLAELEGLEYLESATWITLERAGLSSLELPGLVFLQNLDVFANAELQTINIPQIVSIGEVEILDNPELEHLRGLPLLSGASLFAVQRNASLYDLGTNQLAFSSIFTVTNNPVLPQCIPLLMLEQLQSSTFPRTVDGNLEGCTCLRVDDTITATCP